MGVSELLLIRHGESEGNLAVAEARAQDRNGCPAEVAGA